MKFGNWNITTTAIEWGGAARDTFAIDRSTLLETIPAEAADGDNLYKWIVVATEEEWLTEDDLYDLNFAFAFTAGIDFPESFRYDIFDNTLEFQYNNLEAEEDDE